MSRVAWLGMAFMLGTLLEQSAAAARQDADVLGRWYAAGVHAYFAGDFLQARRQLTRAINSGSRDPRAYYFRAMTYLTTGRLTAAAEADLARGAELEVEDRDGVYPISRSLERIQGRTRLLIENYRRRAEIDQYERGRRLARQRYEQLRYREQDVLRRQITVPLESLARPTVAVAASEGPVNQARARPASAQTVTPPPGSDNRAEARSAAADADPFADQKPAPAPPVIAVPDEQKIETGKLGRTLAHIFAQAMAGDSQAAAPAEHQNAPASSQPPPAASEAKTADAKPGDTKPGDRPAAAPKSDSVDEGDPFADDELADVQGEEDAPPGESSAAAGQEQESEQASTGAETDVTEDEEDPVAGESGADEDDPFGGASDADADAGDDPFAE